MMVFDDSYERQKEMQEYLNEEADRKEKLPYRLPSQGARASHQDLVRSIEEDGGDEETKDTVRQYIETRTLEDGSPLSCRKCQGMRADMERRI